MSYARVDCTQAPARVQTFIQQKAVTQGGIKLPFRGFPGVDRERIAPSSPTQTGQAVLPHPAFQFVVADGLAQALDSRLAEESLPPRGLAPRSPVFQAVHGQVRRGTPSPVLVNHNPLLDSASQALAYPTLPGLGGGCGICRTWPVPFPRSRGKSARVAVSAQEAEGGGIVAAEVRRRNGEDGLVRGVAAFQGPPHVVGCQRPHLGRASASPSGLWISRKSLAQAHATGERGRPRPPVPCV